MLRPRNDRVMRMLDQVLIAAGLEEARSSIANLLVGTIGDPRPEGAVRCLLAALLASGRACRQLGVSEIVAPIVDAHLKATYTCSVCWRESSQRAHALGWNI